MNADNMLITVLSQSLWGLLGLVEEQLTQECTQDISSDGWKKKEEKEGENNVPFIFCPSS